MKRRHFLQAAGSTFATLGLSQWNIIQQGNRYAKVLAQDTPRKLALLVGINHYPNSKNFGDLRGCVNDVELQRRLLIHRFGFNEKDILTLTDHQATRQGILTAFEEHLIKQAKPEDIVVFHFSGHGSRLYDPHPIQSCINIIANDEFNSTLIPTDEESSGYSKGIMGRSLFLLTSALQTQNVTIILDSCYSGGGTRGNFRVRSGTVSNLTPSAEEIAYQQQWMERLQLSETELAKQRCLGVAKGVVIASAQRDQEALDGTFNGFWAGAFTYLLSQYLWQQANTVEGAIESISRSLKSFTFRQDPFVDGGARQPVYFTQNLRMPADAVITQVSGNQATLWLGGVDYEGLEAFQPGASFAILDNNGQASGELELLSRKGLIGQANLINKGQFSLKPGMLLQESSRIIPADLRLTIGLDHSLENMKLAAQKISAIHRIQAVPAQPADNSYSTEVQYILSRMPADYPQHSQNSLLPEVGSIGLFTAAFEVVPQSFGEPAETLTEAIQRLEPTFKSLLAGYVVKKTLNAHSSELNVDVSMNLLADPTYPLIKLSTRKNRSNLSRLQQVYSNTLPLNQFFQFQVTHYENKPLYLTSLLIDSTGKLIVIFPYHWPVFAESMQLLPNQTLTIGDINELRLKAIEKGTGTVLIILSTTPMTKSIKTLSALANEQNRSIGAIELSREPVDIIGDLLEDLSRGGLGVQARMNPSEIASLSMTFQVGDESFKPFL
jgi:hypothetical protein